MGAVNRCPRVLVGTTATVALTTLVLAGSAMLGASAGNASAAGMTEAAPVASIAAIAPGSTVFVPVAPARLADTRAGQGVTRLDVNTIKVVAAGRAGVPRDATAVVVTVTIADATKTGFLTVFPSGKTPPNASNVNYERGTTIANTVAVVLGDGGALSIYASTIGAKLIVDVSGAFVPANGPSAAGRYVPTAGQRVLDTRAAAGGGRFAPGETRVVRLDPAAVPPGALAVVANLTYTDPIGPGFFTAWSGGPRPNSSDGNLDAKGGIRAHLAVIPIGQVGGRAVISLFSSAGAHAIVDVTGWFSGPGDTVDTIGMFIPSPPVRMLDTRLTGGAIAPQASAMVPISGGIAAWANITSTEGGAPSYVSARPAFTPPTETSTLNTSTAHQTIANAAVINLSSVGAQLFSATGEQLIADISGVFSGNAVAAQCRLVVLVHGGGYTGGSPDDLQVWARRFEAAGWRVVNVAYHLADDPDDALWGVWYPRNSIYQPVPPEMLLAHRLATADLSAQLRAAVSQGCITDVLGYSAGGSMAADAVNSTPGISAVHLVASAILNTSAVGGPPMYVWHSSNDAIIADQAAQESCSAWQQAGSVCEFHNLGEQPGAHLDVELDAATDWLTLVG